MNRLLYTYSELACIGKVCLKLLCHSCFSQTIPYTFVYLLFTSNQKQQEFYKKYTAQIPSKCIHKKI